jgi:hypothetical protein
VISAFIAETSASPDISVAKDIVRRHAGLAAIQNFAEHDAPCGERYIGGAVHDAGAFAAQLQHHRGQRVGGAVQHLPAHGLAAGEKDLVEPLVQQGLIFGPAAGDDGHIFGREALAQQLGQRRAGRRGIGAGLDHHGVARRRGRR